MGITWIAPSTTPALKGSASITAGESGFWMEGVEGEAFTSDCKVLTIHTEQIAASVSVTCSPDASVDGITVGPSDDGTGFKVTGTPNIWNINNYTHTGPKLTRYDGSQPDHKTYTVTCTVIWNYMISGIPQPPATYIGIYSFKIMNCWQKEKASVLANIP